MTNTSTCERSTQSDLSDWVETTRASATQTDEPPLPERSYTPPGTQDEVGIAEIHLYAIINPVA